MKHKIILLAVFSVFLASCASVRTPWNESVQSDLLGKTILLITPLDGSFVLRADGLTRFETVRTEIDVTEWALSDAITSDVVQALKGDYKIKVLDDDERSAFYDIDSFYRTYIGAYTSQMQLIQNAAKKCDCDAVLIINPSRFLALHVPNERGYGIYQESAFWLRDAYLYAGVRAMLYDGTTGKEYEWDEVMSIKKIESWIDIKEQTDINEISEWKDPIRKSMSELTMIVLSKMRILRDNKARYNASICEQPGIHPVHLEVWLSNIKCKDGKVKSD